MRRRFNTLLLFAGLLAFVMADSASAQGIRAMQTWYLYPKVGLAQYTGDRDPSLGDLWDFRSAPEESFTDNYGIKHFPGVLALEIGYQFNAFSLGLEGAWGWYPTAADDFEVDSDGDDTDAQQLKLIGRYTFGYDRWPVAPFIQVGGFITNAVEDQLDDPGDHRLGYGPLAGVGLDIKLNNHLSFMAEAQGLFSFPDNAFDGVRDNEDGGAPDEDDGFASFDLLNTLTLGLKYNFKSAVVAPVITSIDCPTTVMEDDMANFSVTLNENVTQPVEVRWDFGAAGATGTGMTTSYTFANPGTYTVSVTAMNRGGEATETCVVTVERRPIPASISSLTANPSRFQACEPTTVTFNANVSGDEPLTYAWNFGDGTTGTGGPNATHTYSEPGTYTVTLTVTAPTGPAATRTTTVVVEECEDECDDITELNSVYFPRNSSTLTAEGRAALAENLEVLRECPDICVRIEGWAAPGERNAQQLSEDRARAVAQYFQDNGIAASRMAAVGMGLVPGTTTKKEGGAQNQRADVIPVPCNTLNR